MKIGNGGFLSDDVRYYKNIEDTTKLQQENERLKEENNILKELNVCVGCETDYKARIDKAVEYIENYCIGNLQYENKTHKVLLNILRGEDK